MSESRGECITRASPCRVPSPTLLLPSVRPCLPSPADRNQLTVGVRLHDDYRYLSNTVTRDSPAACIGRASSAGMLRRAAIRTYKDALEATRPATSCCQVRCAAVRLPILGGRQGGTSETVSPPPGAKLWSGERVKGALDNDWTEVDANHTASIIPCQHRHEMGVTRRLFLRMLVEKDRLFSRLRAMPESTLIAHIRRHAERMRLTVVNMSDLTRLLQLALDDTCVLIGDEVGRLYAYLNWENKLAIELEALTLSLQTLYRPYEAVAALCCKALLHLKFPDNTLVSIMEVHLMLEAIQRLVAHCSVDLSPITATSANETLTTLLGAAMHRQVNFYLSASVLRDLLSSCTCATTVMDALQWDGTLQPTAQSETAALHRLLLSADEGLHSEPQGTCSTSELRRAENAKVLKHMARRYETLTATSSE